MRLIDADELLKRAIPMGWSTPLWVSDIMIQDAPTIEERKRGTWIPQDYNKTIGMASTAVYYYPKCSVCGQCANYTNFCPNCGADMREEKNDAEEIH